MTNAHKFKINGIKKTIDVLVTQELGKYKFIAEMEAYNMDSCLYACATLYGDNFLKEVKYFYIAKHGNDNIKVKFYK